MAYDDDLAVLDAQMQLLDTTIAGMTDGSLRHDSALPGWSRGHVLAHIDGNARGLGRLVRAAGDGVPRQMYQSGPARDADIEWRAGRDLGQHRAAVTASGADLRRDLQSLEVDRREETIALRNGAQFRADEVVLLRIQEVAIHHSDLGLASFTWRDWPERLVRWRVRRLVDDLLALGAFPVDCLVIDADRVDVASGTGVTVSGEGLPMMAWLTGRSAGDDLLVRGADSLPTKPAWW